MARARLFIGGDSGPLHVAATTAVPMVALFGPTLPARSMPWRSPAHPAIALEPGPLACRPCHQRTCVHGDFRCLSAITPDAVIAAARTLLEAGRDHRHRDAQRSGRQRRSPRERVGWWALVGVVASLQLSIAAAQICLAMAVAAWLARVASTAGALVVPAIAWPLVAYALWTLLSAGVSRDPSISVPDTKQLVLFLLVPVVYRVRARAAGPHAGHGCALGRRGQRVHRRRAVRPAQLRQPRPPAAGHAVALDDLLGHADAGHLRQRRAAALRSARSGVGGGGDAGAGRRARADLHPQRLGRRLRRRRRRCSC